MKVITYLATDGSQRLGALRGEDTVSLSAASGAKAFTSMRALIEAGPAAWQEARSAIDVAPVADDFVRLLAPLPRPAQIRDSMCSHQHIRQCAWTAARMAGQPDLSLEDFLADYALPEVYSRQPVYYKCNRFAVGHPDSDVIWPHYSKVMDFELELAAVIGMGGKDIPVERALDHVFGFTIFNDFSARDAQGIEMAGRLGPAKGKDFDGANVFGPAIVTTDEIADPQNLRMTASVNGKVWCDNNSSTIDWTFAQLISHISQGETICPAEIICSGTVGDGCGLEHGRFLADGDMVELEVEKIGRLRNRVTRQAH